MSTLFELLLESSNEKDFKIEEDIFHSLPKKQQKMFQSSFRLPNYPYIKSETDDEFKERCIIYIHKINKIPIGFAYVEIGKDKTRGYLCIGIKLEYQNKGYGEALLNGLIKKCKTAGIKYIDSGCHKENIASTKFHKKNGFKVVGEKSNEFIFERKI